MRTRATLFAIGASLLCALAIAQDAADVPGVRLAQQAWERALDAAAEEYRAKVSAADAEYQRKLAAAHKAHLLALRSVQAAEARKGNQSGADAVRAAADALEAAGPLASAAPGGEDPRTSRWRTDTVRITAGADDTFELRLNGQVILKADRIGVISTDVKVRRGDVITVRARNAGGARGFICSITGEMVQVATAPDAKWLAYLPGNEEQWWVTSDAEQIRATATEGGGAIGRLSAEVEQESGLRSRSIWGTRDVCYLALKLD